MLAILIGSWRMAVWGFSCQRAPDDECHPPTGLQHPIEFVQGLAQVEEHRAKAARHESKDGRETAGLRHRLWKVRLVSPRPERPPMHRPACPGRDRSPSPASRGPPARREQGRADPCRWPGPTGPHPGHEATGWRPGRWRRWRRGWWRCARPVRCAAPRRWWSKLCCNSTSPHAGSRCPILELPVA